MNSDPRELCSCPPPYTGSSCDECFDGFFLSSLTGDCEECQCNSRAETCTSGSGDCIVSEHVHTGMQRYETIQYYNIIIHSITLGISINHLLLLIFRLVQATPLETAVMCVLMVTMTTIPEVISIVNLVHVQQIHLQSKWVTFSIHQATHDNLSSLSHTQHFM